MKRLLPFLIIVVVGVVTVGVATMFYRAKTEPAAKPTAANQQTTASGTPSSGGTPAAEQDSKLHVRGPSDAPLTIEIYGDFQCPSCAVASKFIDELQMEHPGKIRVVFHEFPLQMHRHAKEAAMAAEAAALQGKFWEMHDNLYRFQDVWSKISDVTTFFESYARMAGLDIEKFNADRTSMAVEDRIIEDGTDGTIRGVVNTPTMFFNNTMFKGAFSKDKLKEAVEAALPATK